MGRQLNRLAIRALYRVLKRKHPRQPLTALYSAFTLLA